MLEVGSSGGGDMDTRSDSDGCCGCNGGIEESPPPQAIPATNYDDSPFISIWETTQACNLACRHCRASAQPNPLPGELTTDEGKKLIKDIKDMGCSIVVLSGGDPLKRQDLLELLRYGKSIGLRMATIPAATELLTRKVIENLKETKIDQVAFSLDFPTSELHDGFRRAQGTFDKTMEAVGWARECNLPVQINTTITAQSLPYLQQMGELIDTLGIVFWEVFFLVPTGRGKDLSSLTADQCEEAFELLDKIHRRSSFILKVTEAPHYRRFAAQKEGKAVELPEHLRRSEAPQKTIGLARHAVNSGKGFMFVSYKGDVFPSGFLPIHAGNIRQQGVADIYRNSKVFRELRDASLLLGKCGRCEFREICGGSRSRAYALTHNHLASDPWCSYQPGSL